MKRWKTQGNLLAVALAAFLLAAGGCKPSEQKNAGTQPSTQSAGGGKALRLRSASYDPTREMYAALNPQFQKHWKEKTGQDVTVETFHGPSGSQAQAIAEGNEADIAALSIDVDIDRIAAAGKIDKEWRKEFPNDSVPYVSAVVFMVRKGNPKGIKDWEDLARDDVTALAPDPMTGGGARWIYLSAWTHALRKAAADGKAGADAETAARAFTTKVYDDAVLDPAMRGSTTRFVQGEEGDVLFGWENEILQVVNDPSIKGQYEIVLPSDSITIEVPIATVDAVVDAKGTREAAKAYVDYLYSDAGQDLIAQFYNRPYSEAAAKKHADKFPPLKLYRFREHFKDWPGVTAQHFPLKGEGELTRMRKR